MPMKRSRLVSFITIAGKDIICRRPVAGPSQGVAVGVVESTKLVEILIFSIVLYLYGS